MMEETYLVEHIKEVASFVSLDLASDLVAAKAGRHAREYVLPDGVSNGKGYLRLSLTKAQQKEAAKEGKEAGSLKLSRYTETYAHVWRRLRVVKMRPDD